MDVIIVRLTASKLARVQSDHPHLAFIAGESFQWSPKIATISYATEDENGFEHLLHELSHALLEHNTYVQDISLIKLERSAWTYAASVLAKQYGISISEDLIEDDLDTYRDWLHARSLCPKCAINGIQANSGDYNCILCRTTWHSNNAISTRLRRYKKTSYL